MEKVWVVTGEYAYPMVKEYIDRYVRPRVKNIDVRIVKIPVKVIGLATAEIVLYYLKDKLRKMEKPDIILVPGLVRGDLRFVQEELGVRVVRGPRRLEQLGLAFMIGVENLDPVRPAEEIIYEKLRGIVEKAAEERMRQAFIVNGVRIPIIPPPFTTALVLDHGLGLEWLEKYIGRTRPDLLALPPYEPSEDLVELLDKLREYKGRIIAPLQYLDTVKSIGINPVLVYGVLPEQVETVEKDKGIILETYSDPGKAVEKAMDMPERIVLDASLPTNPSRLLDKLNYMRMVHGVAKSCWPTNIGWGIDADSHGIYGLLLPLLAGAGIGLLIIWELEEKLYHSFEEIKILEALYLLSAHTGQDPRGLGIDLLMVKPRFLHWYNFEKPSRTIDAWANESITLDPMGIFKIRVDHRKGYIEALYMGRKGRILIRGRTAREIRDTIIREGLVSRLDHAAYIGGELAKAEEALRNGLDYVQDTYLLPSRRDKLGLTRRGSEAEQ
ncbi:MAG: DUF4346 domain-containing protein [Crenarchaeota archaeon]|nr:DUF4346 domain-containing protein [Thermoproteota archaeon]